MKKIRKLATLVLAALLALALAAPAAFAQSATASASASAAAGEAMVRVAHLSSDAPNVDVYVNGEPVPELLDVPYGTVSPYLPLPAGTQQVTVYAAGDTTTPVIDVPVELAGGAAYTVGAIGLVEDGSITAQVYEDDLTAPAAGNAKVRAIHASPDAGPVDIAAGGDVLVPGLTYPDASDYAEVPADTYDIEVLAAGTNQAAISAPDTDLADGTVYSAFAVGTAAAGNLELILVPDSMNGSATMPDTGGVSPGALASGALGALLLSGGLAFFALRHRTAS